MKIILAQILLACTVFSFTVAIGLKFNDHKPKPHTCEYVTCPYKGETIYKHQHTGADNEITDDEGSDCDALDWVHFNHPSLNYDECETLLFSNLK